MVTFLHSDTVGEGKGERSRLDTQFIDTVLHHDTVGKGRWRGVYWTPSSVQYNFIAK